MTAIAIITESRLRPSSAADGDGHQQSRDREHHVDHPHDHGVDPAAEGAGQDAEQQAAGHAQQKRDHAHQQRRTGPEHDAAELVAAELVQAEPELGGRPGDVGRCDDAGTGSVGGVVRRDPGREDSHQDEEGNEREPDDSDRVAAQPAPGVLAEAAALLADLRGLGGRLDLGQAHCTLTLGSISPYETSTARFTST